MEEIHIDAPFSLNIKATTLDSNEHSKILTELM